MRVPGFFLLTLCLLAQSAAAEPLPGLESFVDGVMASVTTQRNAGVQVAIVKDGRALLSGTRSDYTISDRPNICPERKNLRSAQGRASLVSCKADTNGTLSQQISRE